MNDTTLDYFDENFGASPRATGATGGRWSLSPQFLRHHVARPPKPETAQQRQPKATKAAVVSEGRTIDLFCAQVRTYEELREAVCARVNQLNISRRNLDEVAGLTDGHSGKLLAPGEIKKHFGMLTLGLMLQACGLRLLVVDDRDALAKAERKFVERKINQVRSGNLSRRTGARKRRCKKSSSRA
jgi:hypothetical protein